MKKQEYSTQVKNTSLLQDMRTMLSAAPYVNVGVNQYVRLNDSDISSLGGILKDVTQEYLNKVLDKQIVKLSGDVYYGKVQDAKGRKWGGFIFERPSDYRGNCHITQDTIGLSSFNTGDCALMYVHSNYDGRYMALTEFDQYRNSLKVGLTYNISPITAELSNGGFIARGFENIRINCGKR